MNVSLDRIGQIHITVSDVDRAVDFYRDVLGMEFLFRVPGQPMAFFNCGGVRLYLGEAESPEYRSAPLIYYSVPSIDDAYETLAGLAVGFDDAPHVVHRTDEMELWMVFLRDPDGNPVALMEERPL